MHSTTIVPTQFFHSWSRYSSSPRNTRRSIPVQNAPMRSHTNPERGQLAPKPVDVFGPSAPRTHVAAFTCPVAASGSCAVCARRCALPPAVSPLGRAPCSVALPSLAGWSSPSRSARDRWSPGEVRAYQTVRRSDEYSARSRCYSRQHKRRKLESHEGRKEQ